MGQLQKVSWRTVGYAALGTAVAAASVVAIVNSDGVRPTALTSSAATRWLFDQHLGRAVLVDGLAGRVVAKVDAEAPDSTDVAVQGAGGAFLVAKAKGSVRAISTAKLQLGTAQPVSSLLDPDVKFGVGASGLTVVSAPSGTASVVAVNDVARPVTIRKSKQAYVAADGSMWLISGFDATHVNVDESTTTTQMPSRPTQVTTVGAHGITYDNRGTLRWIGGNDVVVQQSIPNPSEAILQQPGDDAPCVWMGVADTLICVGPTKIEQTLKIRGMNLSTGGDKLAVAGDAAVVVGPRNEVTRIDLETRQMAKDENVLTVRAGAGPLSITASGNLVWLDDQGGDKAWVVHRFGINTIDKADRNAPLLDAQGQVKAVAGAGGGAGPGTGTGNNAGDDNASHEDHNGQEDPPHATDDSVTARAGATVTIPVTSNDWDPDNEPFAVSAVGAAAGTAAANGSTDILDGNTVSYVPSPGFNGIDKFGYTIIDVAGKTSTATVTVEVFPPGSPNRPPVARPDSASTTVGHPITIDVLANDIDPERDTLSVAPFRQAAIGISDTTGPTNLPALKYVPPNAPGKYTFTYQAIDPQGGTSEKTLVTVIVSAANGQNAAPVAHDDAVRLRVGVEAPLNVKANDTDADGDDLMISLPESQPKGVTVGLQGQQLLIKLLPSAPPRLIVHYLLTDKDPTKPATGSVLVVRIDDTAPNHPPVANPDADRVVIGNSVLIPVTTNDVDPDKDTILLLSATGPNDGSGTVTIEKNSVRFVPTLPDIKEPTASTFTYRITDGNGNEATGRVTVTVLLQALPKAPSARDDFVDTETDKPVTIDVLANDTDPSGGGRPQLTTNPVCADGGSAIRTPDNRVTYTPPLGLTGTFRCGYSVTNSQGFQDKATIIITVVPPKIGNRQPKILLDIAGSQTTMVGKNLVLNANVLATDPDGDPLVFSAVGKPLRGQTDFSGASSTITYSPPAVGSAETGPFFDNFEVTISDGHNGTDSGKISIKLINQTPTTVAPAPPVIHDVQTSATTGVPLSFDVIDQLRGANPNDTLTLLNASADSSLGTAQAVNGLINIVPNAAGTLFVSYTVQNVAGAKADGKVKVSITDPVQANPPVAIDDTLLVASGGVGSVRILDNDQGITDPGDKVSVQINARPPASFGSLDYQNGTVSFVAAAGAYGSVDLTYTLKDGSGSQSTAHLVITVQKCAESHPQARDGNLFTPYQTPIDIDLSAYIVTGHLQPGSVRGAGLTGLTGTYTPPAGMNGLEVVTFTVQNGCQETTLGRLTIDVNHSPLGGNANRNMSGGDSLTLALTDLASDDEPLSITSLASNPAWATFSPSSVTLSPPPGTASGTYTFTVNVQDPGGLTATATINVTISNTPPTAVADAYATTESLYSFNPTSNDFDSEAGQLCVQTISVTSPASGTDIVPPNPEPQCKTSITVSLAHGVSMLSYTISDAGGLTSSSTITITSNHPPTIANATAATGGQPTVDIPLDITDLDGDSLRVGCNTPTDFIVAVRAGVDQNPPDPTHPNFEVDVTVSPTFNDDPNNSAQFTCTVRDAYSAATATVTVTVN